MEGSIQMNNKIQFNVFWPVAYIIGVIFCALDLMSWYVLIFVFLTQTKIWFKLGK